MSLIRKSNNKYVCKDKEKLREFMRKEGFIFKNSVLQKDEYFIDLQGKMIKDDSCIRLRTIKDKNIILSFDGKVENISQIDIEDSQSTLVSCLEYDNIVDFLADLGFYKYISVNVLKETYVKKENEFYYTIGVDTAENIGEFIDFEIYTDIDDFKRSENVFNTFKNELEKSLEGKINFKYRDFFSKYIYNNFFKGNNLKKILVELDKIINMYSINNIENDIRNKYVISNLELIEKLEQRNLEVSIVYNSKDEELVYKIKEVLNKIGYNPKFLNIKEIKEISVKETLILEKQKKYSFSEVALVILNNMNL